MTTPRAELLLRPTEATSKQPLHEEAGAVLTVVMPVFNEGDGVREAVDEVQHEILDCMAGATLLAVDDGSTDDSGTLLDQCAQEDPRIRVLHQPNRGHGGALLAGLEVSESEYVFLIDSDRQIPLDGFLRLWTAVRSGRRAAVGVRRTRGDAAMRIVLTVLIRRVIRILFDVRVHDANIPFKLVRRDDWLAARHLIPDDTLAPSLFLGVFLKLRGLDVAEIEVSHRDRMTGRVSVRGWRMARFCARAFVQLVRFRWRYGQVFRRQEPAT